MSYHEVDINTWKRKEPYHFFRSFDSPFFNMTANVDVTALYDCCKKEQLSFFLAGLFYSTLAVNSIEEFRYRIRNEKLVCYDKTDPGCTIFMDDETFRYGYFYYNENIKAFNTEGLQIIEAIKSNAGFDPKPGKDDIIYYSVIPWLSFTSFEHAKRHNSADSIPRIVFGKYFRHNNRLLMPVSVQVNHALLDGFHVSMYFKRFEQMIESPAI